MLTHFDWFTCLGEWEERREYHAINIELIHEWMVALLQTESNPVDEYWIDNLWIVIIFFELDSFFLNLFEFGDDFSFSQIFQDLHVVNPEDLSEELLSGFSTSQGVGVFDGGFEIFMH